MPNLNRVLIGIGAVFGIAALVGVLIFLHTRAVSKYGDERYQAGKADAYAAVESEARKQQAKDTAVAVKLKDKYDAEDRHITASADAIKLHGPGKGLCTSTVAEAPADREPGAASGRASDATVGELRSTERTLLVALPFDATVAFAAQCDAYRNEVIVRREQEGSK